MVPVRQTLSLGKDLITTFRVPYGEWYKVKKVSFTVNTYGSSRLHPLDRRTVSVVRSVTGRNCCSVYRLVWKSNDIKGSETRQGSVQFSLSLFDRTGSKRVYRLINHFVYNNKIG